MFYGLLRSFISHDIEIHKLRANTEEAAWDEAFGKHMSNNRDDWELFAVVSKQQLDNLKEKLSQL